MDTAAFATQHLDVWVVNTAQLLGLMLYVVNSATTNNFDPVLRKNEWSLGKYA